MSCQRASQAETTQPDSSQRKRLYVVDVKGGGTFLYDTVDVGRWVLRMAEVGDERPFTVKPCPRWRRFLSRLRDEWELLR